MNTPRTFTSILVSCGPLVGRRAAILTCLEPEMLATTRRNLPVTIQRRFQVYPNVAEKFVSA